LEGEVAFVVWFAAGFEAVCNRPMFSLMLVEFHPDRRKFVIGAMYQRNVCASNPWNYLAMKWDHVYLTLNNLDGIVDHLLPFR
jgi:hypothetical protein